MSIPKPGEYGEPIQSIPQRSGREKTVIRSADGIYLAESMSEPGARALVRAAACVSAMNGRDVEKLSGLEDAIRSAWIARKQQPALPVPIGLDVIFAAARAFGTIKENPC